jgi:c-di-GMP-binding flagellar brake protein YcgR
VSEKREFVRVVFDLEDGYIGDFRLSGGERFSAMITNLSGGGMGLAVPRERAEEIKSGHELVLKKIIGTANLTFLSDVATQIVWIRDMETPDFVNAGCEFHGLAGETLEQIIRFVDSERKDRGQYD